MEKTSKIIHYCWFGNKPLPKSAKKCIKSWKKFMPDYEIKQWNESNYNVNKCKFMKQAYKHKKFGFVPDYARFDIVYKYGGIYLDTDVELIKPLDDLVNRGAFIGLEQGTISDLIKKSKRKGIQPFINPGQGFYGPPNLKIFKTILNKYEKLSFKNEINYLKNIVTSPKIVTKIIKSSKIIKKNGYGYCNGLYIYPKDYFNPIVNFEYGGLHITKNTRSIHHFDGLWLSKKERRWLKRMRKKHEKLGHRGFIKYKNSLKGKAESYLYYNGYKKTMTKILKHILKIK